MAFFDKLGDFAKNIGDKTSDAIETNKLNGKINTEKTAITECLRKIGDYYYDKHKEGAAGDEGIADLLATIDGHHQAIADLQAEIERIKAENAAPAAAAAAPVVEVATPADVICPECGAENTPETKFCRACGKNLTESAVEAEPEVTAVVAEEIAAEAVAKAETAAETEEILPDSKTEPMAEETVITPQLACETEATAEEAVVEKAVVAQELVLPIETAAPDAFAGNICPDCGAENAPGTKFCRACGKNLAGPVAAAVPEPRICPVCSTANAPGVKFCGTCGHKFD